MNDPNTMRHVNNQAQIIVTSPDIFEARRKIDLYRVLADLPPLETSVGVHSSLAK